MGRNYVVKLKAVGYRADFVHRSVPNSSTSVRSKFLDYFFLPKCLLPLMTAVGLLLPKVLHVGLVDFYGHPRDKKHVLICFQTLSFSQVRGINFLNIKLATLTLK